MQAPDVPFNDLARQTARYREELQNVIARVFGAGRYVMGEELDGFERAFASYCGTRFAVGVASGTDAITIALQTAGVGPDDEVITAANTCVPTIVGIEGAQARPVLVDCEESTYTLDPALIEEAITPRTRAIVPVHLYGQCADLDPILALAQRYGIQVVEDCAQAHGAEYGGRRAGSSGIAGAFSFYPTKNLGALGDGGAVVTNDPDVAERARLLRNYGERERFEHILRGRNSRLDSLQAALLAAKLKHLDDWNRRRRELAERYTSVIDDSIASAPLEAQRRRHVYHLYVVRVRQRDRFRKALAGLGVETAIHYPTPVQRQPAYADLLPADRSLATSERLAGEIVSLPLYPDLSDDEASRVASAVIVAAEGDEARATPSRLVD
jgi:dTDP-4-amino-4,6-dideoxygalactose transaminase